MPSVVPDLRLTHGQLLWAVSLGREPSEEVRDRGRYLRQLGIPRPVTQPVGRGHHLVYGFDDLALVGFGLLGLSEGFRPRALTEYLVDQRDRMLAAFRYVWTELAESVLDESWVKMRGRSMPLVAEPFYLRLHGRARGEMAGIELVKGNGTDTSPHLIPYEVIPGETPEKVFIIDYWLPQWVAWALEAPAPRRGRRPAAPAS